MKWIKWIGLHCVVLVSVGMVLFRVMLHSVVLHIVLCHVRVQKRRRGEDVSVTKGNEQRGQEK